MGKQQQVYAKLPAYNPFVGTFHHAPSAGNRGAAFFKDEIIDMAEFEERKKFRHNPFSGIFHILPGYYDPLHDLSVFRRQMKAKREQQKREEEIKRQFVAVDLDEEDLEFNLDADGERHSYTNGIQYDHMPFYYIDAEKTRPRGFSDSEMVQTYSNGEKQFIENSMEQTSTARTATATTTAVIDSRDVDDDEGHDSTESKHTPPPLKVRVERGRTLSHDRLKPPPPDRSEERKKLVRKASRGKVIPTLSEPIKIKSPETHHSSQFALDWDGSSLRHSSESLSSTESDEAASPRLLTPTDPSSISSSPLSEDFIDGYISTGKGIFRKFGFCSSGSLEKKRQKMFEKHNFEYGVSSSSFSETSDDSVEYAQEAPRVPANPFVARRLTDGDEIRLMAINRAGPRNCFVHFRTPAHDIEDENVELPKPYFIHEAAVTDHYEMVGEDQLGDGSYAVVKPGISRDNGKEVAIKQIHKRYLRTEDSRKAVDREVEIHLRLRHRNIVRLYEIYETTDFLYLVMEKANHGNLKDLLQVKRRLPEAEAVKIAQQIVRAVFFCHGVGVLHCDLKPENVLLNDPKASVPDSNSSSGSETGSKVSDLNVQLCDFGLSVKVPDVRFYKYTGDVHKVPFTGVTGTVGYIAPELLQQQSYGKPVDMWSVGIMIYEMLCGFQPFYPPQACVDEPADFNERIWKKFSSEAKDLCQNLLCRDPIKRFTAEEALAHPWFDTAMFSL